MILQSQKQQVPYFYVKIIGYMGEEGFVHAKLDKKVKKN